MFIIVYTCILCLNDIDYDLFSGGFFIGCDLSTIYPPGSSGGLRVVIMYKGASKN